MLRALRACVYLCVCTQLAARVTFVRFAVEFFLSTSAGVDTFFIASS